MKLSELQSRLHDLGADIPQNTLKRWGYDGLIPRPKRIKKGKGGGKGRAVSWSGWALAEAGAIWAVKNAGILKVPPSKKVIEIIKFAEDSIRRYQSGCYLPPRGPGTEITAESISVKFISDGFPDLYLFPGRTPADKSDVLNSLVVVWICAIEKVKKGMSLREPARVIIHWTPRPASDPEWEDDPYEFDGITVEKADRDEVIEYINGIDIRKLAARSFVSNAPSTRIEKNPARRS